MRNPEVGPEPFEAIHNPELPPKACLLGEIAIVDAEGLGKEPQGHIVSEAVTESGRTLTELVCEQCSGHCFVLHNNWRDIEPVDGEPGFNLESCVVLGSVE